MRHNAQEKDQSPSSVHDREPAPRGRHPGGAKSKRLGYPALFLGSAAVTKTLTEIAAWEPVAINDLPERRNVTDANLGHTVRRLIALGLVRRYRRPDHRDRYLLTFDQRHPLADLVRDVLQSIASTNSLTWRPSPSPPKNLAVREGRNVTELGLFGRGRDDIEVLCGHPNRTVAILLVATLGAVDASTIAWVAKVRADGDMHSLLDPLEADGVLISDMFGSIRLYALKPEPWTAALKTLALEVLRQHKPLESRIAPARTLMLTGGFSNRKHLRRRLGFE
jgi:hypothetical protein